jgi:NADP-reducing hydrogenase subunit HndB
MAPLSADDLRKIRTRIQSENAIRNGIGSTRVTVHMGTCGIASGARDVLDALLVDMANHKAADIVVAVNDCIGLCDKEPLVIIHKPGQTPISYANMNPDKMRHVFQEHIIGGNNDRHRSGEIEGDGKGKDP